MPGLLSVLYNDGELKVQSPENTVKNITHLISFTCDNIQDLLLKVAMKSKELP